MPVYDQSYKGWEGKLKSHSLRWWVVTKYGVKTAFKKKAVRGLLMFALLPFIASAVYIYGLTHIGKVSAFVRTLGGGRAMPDLSVKTYDAAIESGLEQFVERLRKEKIGWQETHQGLRIFLPEGENSKRIFAIARQTGTRLKRVMPPGVKPSFYNAYLKRQFPFLFILLLAIGAGLIAKDVKFNALQIYLAKPITGTQYILGKLGILAFFLVMVTLVPELVLFLLQAILVGDSLYIRNYWWIAGAICASSALIALSGALIVLALSALSKNVRSAALGGAAVFWLSPAVAEILRRSTWDRDYMLLSLPYNWVCVGEKIFGLTEMTSHTHWVFSLLIVCGLMVLCGVALLRRVRGVEVVK